MFSFIKIDKKTISTTISMSVNCTECVRDIKTNLYKGRDLSAYVITKDWVKAFTKSGSQNSLSYNVVLKEPIFKSNENLYFDDQFNLFFMPSSFQIPKLFIKKSDVSDKAIIQANTIKENLPNLVALNYSNLSGWQVQTNKVNAYIGKTDLDHRLVRLNKIIKNLEENNSKLILLDLRYHQGYVLKNI
jgi:hypothetical protein